MVWEKAVKCGTQRKPLAEEVIREEGRGGTRREGRLESQGGMVLRRRQWSKGSDSANSQMKWEISCASEIGENSYSNYILNCILCPQSISIHPLLEGQTVLEITPAFSLPPCLTLLTGPTTIWAQMDLTESVMTLLAGSWAMVKYELGSYLFLLLSPC